MLTRLDPQPPLDVRFADATRPPSVVCAIPSEHLRCAAGALAIYLCGGDFRLPQFMGARELDPTDPQRPAFGDPIYEWVTLHLQEDNRKQRAAGADWIFSSCAYLPHIVLELLGWRFPWLGRGTRKAPRYQPIARLNTLADQGRARQRKDARGLILPPAASDWDLLRGDVVQIGTTPRTTHVQIVLEWDPGAGVLRTADYGQPGGALREHVVTVQRWQGAVRLLVGKRPLMRRLSLATLGLPQAPAELPQPVFDYLEETL